MKKPTKTTGKQRCGALRHAVQNGHIKWTPGVAGSKGQPGLEFGAAVNQKALRQLLELQERRCLISNIRLTPATVSLDHVVPMSRGGTHTVENVMIVHSDINRSKGAMSLADFLGMCAAITHRAQLCGLDTAKLAQQWREYCA